MQAASTGEGCKMAEVVLRVGVLVLVSLVLCLLAWSGRRFVEKQRQAALAAVSADVLLETSEESMHALPSAVHILAFNSADCHQCHQLQAPALQRVLEARGPSVAVMDVDAPASPELTQRYHVLTVPTTVVLDATGRTHAVNYGFANTGLLLAQVDAILAA